MNIEELESAVSKLSTEDLARFSEWFEEFRPTNGIGRSKRICGQGNWIQPENEPITIPPKY